MNKYRANAAFYAFLINSTVLFTFITVKRFFTVSAVVRFSTLRKFIVDLDRNFGTFSVRPFVTIFTIDAVSHTFSITMLTIIPFVVSVCEIGQVCGSST